MKTSFLKNFKFFLITVVLFSCAFIFSACAENYDQMEIILSNNGQSVTLFLKDEISTTEDVAVQVVGGGQNVNKQININFQSDKLAIDKTYNGKETTILTLKANGACKDVLVTINSKEGGKSASFYVSVEIPLTSISETTNKSELFAVKGGKVELCSEKLLKILPENTTEKAVLFSIYNPTANASIEKNILSIGEDFAQNTIEILAASTFDSTKFAIITLDVLEPLENIIDFSAFYGNTVNEIDLTSKIEIAKNLDDKNLAIFNIAVDTIREVNLEAYVLSTSGKTSNFIGISEIKKIETAVGLPKEFEATINSETHNGSDAVFFIFSYSGYNYAYTSQLFNIETYDAVTDVAILVDDVQPDEEEYSFIVYEKYFGVGVPGLKINATVFPTTVPIVEQIMILRLGVNAGGYEFFNSDGGKINFTNNEYQFESGKNIFVRAKAATSSEAQFTILSKSNPEKSRTFKISAKVGASNLDFLNATTINNKQYYFLTSNEIMEKQIFFTVEDADVDEISINHIGNGFEVISKARENETNKFYFSVKSIKGSLDEIGIVTIKLPNGLIKSAYVEIFIELDKTEISLSIPSTQYNPAIGQRKMLSDVELNNETFCLEFSVAIQKGKSVDLKVNANSTVSLSFQFYDFVLEDLTAYDAAYENFNSFISSGANNVDNYNPTSTVLHSLYLNINQIYASNIGKVWVKSQVKGFALNNGIKSEVSYDFYFLVEVYSPIKSLQLSHQSITLYALNSVGDENYTDTYKQVSLELIGTPTYNKIVWINVNASFPSDSNLMTYYINNEKIFTFENNGNSVKVEAFSTLTKHNRDGETFYEYANSCTFNFIAKISEFGKTTQISLTVTIKKAEQVQRIVVDSLNIENGIYIELDYKGNDLFYQINARADNGIGNPKPFNDKLIYSFIPDGATSESLISIENRNNNGIIRISEQQVGGTGNIQIAPADRFINGIYTQGQIDIAVYIRITIADGRSRNTAFRITNLDEMTNSELHYILMNSTTVNTSNDYAIFENFGGGLYGSVLKDMQISTISTNKSLFKILESTAIIEDLIVCGNVEESGGFIAEINNGKIKNVTIDTITVSGIYESSKLISLDFDYVGGLVGKNYGNVENCNFYGEIKAENSTVGGIAGLNSGNIINCAVEFYSFKNNYATIQGGHAVGGIVGEMNSGSLTYSYAFSYVGVGDNPKNYMNLEILKGNIVGGLIGMLSGGEVNICFAYVNDIESLVGEISSDNESEILNAYIIYNSTNSDYDAKYVYNGEDNYDYGLIESNEIWQSAQIGINKGFPYFKEFFLEEIVIEIGEQLSCLKNLYSVENKSVAFYYNVNSTLNSQEISVLNSWNTISFTDLLGIENANGIRAISSDSSIIGTYSNGIIFKNCGTVKLTLFSKYDYSLFKEFTIFVVYPILNFSLIHNNHNFSEGTTLYSKINQSFSVSGGFENSILLTNRSVSINTDSLKIVFKTFNDYIQGGGLSNYAFDTQRLYEDHSQTDFRIEHTLSLEKFSSAYSVLSSATDELDEINLIISQFFESYFNLKIFKGADKLELTSREVEFEPSDVYEFESYIFSDIDFEAGVFDGGIACDGECLGVDVFEYDNMEKLQIFEIEIDNCKIIYYIGLTGQGSSDKENAMFVIVLDYMESIYYLNSNNLSEQTQDSDLATYFQHKFKVIIKISDKYKNYSFNESQFLMRFYALTSKQNSETYNSEVIYKDFKLTVKSQSISSINATHYALENKTLYVENGKNVMEYRYQSQSNSVLTPGNEGLLAVDVFPIYADFDYLEVIYLSSDNNYNLRMIPMKKKNEFSFTKSSKGFVSLTNGIQIDNPYEYVGSIENSLASLYLSTFVPETIDRDLVFALNISAFDKNGNQVGVSVVFNLVVQYLKSATVQLLNNNGEEINSVVRGATENLVITVNMEQNLGSVNIKGCMFTSEVNNIITYSKFTETLNPSIGTKIYVASLYVGTGLILDNNSNFFTIEVTISWISSGKMQTKATILYVGVIDFEIESAELKTDRPDKTVFTGYIGIQSSLLFNFKVKDFITPRQLVNLSLQDFYSNYYYESLSDLNKFGDYIVNYGNEGIFSFMGNLFYVNGDIRTQVLRTNGTFAPNDNLTFSVENDGSIKVTGKRTGSVSMLFSLPVKLPSFNRTVIKNIDFYFTINIEVYSDEDTPLIIDSEEAFHSAMTGENPQNYILMTDLFLLDYTPYDTTGIASLDGNNFVIHILSWNQDFEGNVIKLAMFNVVTPETTLKNLIINVYHASSILIDTTKFSDIEIAGFAILNQGVIYNCHIAAFESDFSRPQLETPQGIAVSYSIGKIDSSKTSKIAGFVIENSGLITNSRVGGKELVFALAGAKPLSPFNISGQGDISGFVFNNTGSIASSYFDNGTILNKTSSGAMTFTSGFVGLNRGSIHLSYAKGVGGVNEFSLSEAGINTASVSAGFAHTNRGEIGDCYSNILLTTSNNATQSQYSSGRLTSGFVYDNQGTVERSYTASKVEDAKTTQMNFIGVDNLGNMKNSGYIRNCYYFNMFSDLTDMYSSADINISVRRITEPDLETNFYGFTFTDSQQELNGVWASTTNGPELVSANQIAVSSRYLTDEKRDPITGELVSYSLPYHDNYEYGSKLNPIIIRNAQEFNRVFGGEPLKAGTAISRYYNLNTKLVFGNYRIVSEINLTDLITDSSSGVKVNSCNMTLSDGMIDGNKFVVRGLELVAKIETNVKDYGMFAALKKNAIIMNMRLEVIGVNAVTAQNVGAIAGTVENSKLVNIYLFNGNQSSTSSANVVGNNIVGGVVGKVIGMSELKNLQTDSINAIANHVSTSASQRYNRDETPTNRVNSNTSYAGGIAGIVDIYKEDSKTILAHNDRLQDAQLAFLYVTGNMQINASSVGGIVGYLGPQTLLRDTLFELSLVKNQKLIAYNHSAGGIVGECYGDIDMARAEHEYELQSEIENNVQMYYKNPSSENIERGNLTLFEHDNIGKYSPKYIGGLVGELITGNISHSYSKIPVRNSRAIYAGGIAGAVTYAENNSINNINLLEVYTFSDAYAVSGVGGFAGYIEQSRTLHFDKVNCVNYWTLCVNPEDNKFYLPEQYYDIFAATGSKNYEAKLLKEIVEKNGTNIKIKTNYVGAYTLPVIAHEVQSDDVYAISKVDFDFGGIKNEILLEKSYASLGSSVLIEIISELKHSIKPLYEYVNARVSGSVMDVYFLKSNWDPNYWKRYSDDMLPRLVSIADVNIFYIRIAQDLLNMVYYPDATFIVVGQDGNGIVKCGNYIRQTGLDISNFSGVLKGYDNSGAYGLDFEYNTETFIKSSTSGSKIYSLTIKNIGSRGTYQEGVGTLVGTSYDSGFENLTFENCRLYSYATTNSPNIGLLCGHIKGGYISNVSFEDCAVDVLVQEDIMTLNVGLMTGLITAPVNGYMQISDITSYLSSGNDNNTSDNNSIRINVNESNISYINTGTIAGKTEGAIYLNYTSKSADGGRIKNLGVSDTASYNFTPDTVANNDAYRGAILEITGTQNSSIGEYNAGIGFGKTGVLNLSHQRADAPLVMAGAIVSKGQIKIEKAVVGGYMGTSLTSSAISSSIGIGTSYMYVDCDLKVTAGNVTAGMLIGEAGVVYSLRDVDTYGTINVKSTTNSSYIGGLIGVLNSDLELRNSIVRTVIDFKDEVNEPSAIGGFVGIASSSNAKIKIGHDNYMTKYLGKMKIDSNKIYAGGIIGAFESTSGGSGVNGGVNIFSAVFGGEIVINSTKQAYIGGIIGSSLYESSQIECLKRIESCFAYGNIHINETFDEYLGNTFAGGIIGRGSLNTKINSNNSISTIYTKHTQADEILTVNALVGESNGSSTENDVSGVGLLINRYSHQMSLCLDNSGIASKNIYYKKTIANDEVMFESMHDVIMEYIDQLGSDMEKEAFEGSKLMPFEIRNSNYNSLKEKFTDDVSTISPYAKNKYFVICEDLTNNTMIRVELKYCYILGDGFAIDAQNTVFSEIDSKSTVTGLKVNAQIQKNIATTLGGTSYHGGGALADVNSGFVYSCNATEKQNTSSSFGYENDVSGGYFGGLIGVNAGYVADCFANMNIKGTTNTGGFVGINLGTISHCYCNGSVSSSNAYAFGYNISKIYYSYTASTAINGGVGVFGSGTVVGGYYDVFAADCPNDLGTMEITDRMAVYDAKNLLSSNESFETDPITGQIVGMKIFLKNENKLLDTAKIKFGYDYKYNNGYLTFIGSAYRDLDYMQDNATGTGTEDNPIQIPNIGKFQQLNDSEYVYNYILKRDIALTSNMEVGGELANDEEYINVVNWKPIGTFSNPFEGTVTGKYGNEDSYKIKGIKISDNEDYCGIFGNANEAKISYLDLDYDIDFTANNATYIAGLLGVGKKVEINNIKMSDVKLTYGSSSDVYIGAIVGEVSGESSICNCEIASATFNYSSTGSGNPSYLGGMIGKLEDDSEITACKINGAVSINYDANGGVFAGGIVGQVSGSDGKEGTVDNIEIVEAITIKNSEKSNSSNVDYFGGIAGKADYSSVSNIKFSGKRTFTNNIGSCYMGGWIGEANNTSVSTITETTESKNCSFNVDSTNTQNVSSYIGGLFGRIKEYTISSSSYNLPKSTISFKSSEASPCIGGLAGEIEKIEMNNVSGEFKTNNQVSFDTSADVCFGGIAGIISGTSKLKSGTLSFSADAITFAKKVQKLYFGGLAGKVSGDIEIEGYNVENLYLPEIEIESEAMVGGFIGLIEDQSKSMLTECNLSSGKFEIKKGSQTYLGGIVGKITGAKNNSKLEKCNASCLMQKVTESSNAKMGGIVGLISGPIELSNCEAQGNTNPADESNPDANDFILNYNAGTTTSANVSIGGIVGETSGSTGENGKISIDKCMIKQNFKAVSTGKINYIGGIVGKSLNTHVSNSTEVTKFLSEYRSTGTVYMGGILGYMEDSEIDEGGEGGIDVGVTSSALIVASETNGTLNCEAYTGGIVGYASGNSKISNAYTSRCVVINGSNSSIIGSGAAGGIIGYAKGNSTKMPIFAINKKGGIEGVNVISNKYAGGVVGYGENLEISSSDCKGGNVYSGCKKEIIIPVRSTENKEFDFKNSIESYAGGILGIVENSKIGYCENSANVTSGYTDGRFTSADDPWTVFGGGTDGAMKDWSLYRSEAIVKTGTEKSYAGGIAGFVENTEIYNSKNNGTIEANAKQDLSVKLEISTFFIDELLGTHKLYIGFAKERAYANGIAHIDQSSSLDKCTNSSVVNGGFEIGFNYIYNTSYEVFGNPYDDRFHLLHYGSRGGDPQFNAICYVYSVFTSVRDEIIESGKIFGISMSGTDPNYEYKNTNIFYCNQICNNPCRTEENITIGNLEYIYCTSWGNPTIVTNCTYNGGTSWSFLLTTGVFAIENANRAEPNSGDYIPINWPDVRLNDSFHSGVSSSS